MRAADNQKHIVPPMRVLITGAAGFLGSHTAEAFARRGDEVIPLVRATSRTDFLESLQLKPRPVALHDRTGLAQALRGVEVVVHTAAKVENFGRWEEFAEITVAGTRHVLQAAIAAGVRQFIHISSRGVYERPRQPGEPYDEATPYGQPYQWSYYARAKIEAEQIVRDARQWGRISTTIFRPTWVYGPRDVNIFARLVEALRAGRLKFIGDGPNRMNLVYVTDAVRAIELAAANSRAHDQIYNLAADELSPTQREFVERLGALLDLPLPASRNSYAAAHRLGFLSECAAHATGYRVCPPVSRLSVLLLGGNRHFVNRKLREELGWQPLVGYEDGLRRTVNWYLGRGRPPSPLTVLPRAPETVPSTPRTGESLPAGPPIPDRAARPAAK